MSTYFQLFLIESIMDRVVFVTPEGPGFMRYEDAADCYEKGEYGKRSKGSTEDHEEFKIMEIRNGKLYKPGSTTPLRRQASEKRGDFLIVYSEKGADQVCVETINGAEPLTWRDN